MEKSERVKFIDILIMNLNFIVMIVIAILIFINPFLTSLSILSAVLLIGLTLVTYFRKNPYYTISCYGLVICSLFFSAGLLFSGNVMYSYIQPLRSINTFLLIFFIVTIILDVYFIGRMVRVPEGSWRVKNPWISYGPLIEPNTNVPRYIKESYEPLGYNKDSKAVNLEQKNAFRKKYHVIWILLTTLISTFTFFSTIVLSLLILY